MKTYELHCHSKYSKCSNLEPKKILELAKKKELDGVAIADHNTIKGALEAKELNKDKAFEVIVAEEVKTDLGDALCYYVKKEIKPGKFDDVVKEARKQGCIIVLAHPMRANLLGGYRGFSGDIKKVRNKIDAIEIFNSRTFPLGNMKAKSVAKRLNINSIGGSDAHFAFEFAQTTTSFNGTLKKALKDRKTEVKGTAYLALLGHIATLLKKMFA